MSRSLYGRGAVQLALDRIRKVLLEGRPLSHNDYKIAKKHYKVFEDITFKWRRK